MTRVKEDRLPGINSRMSVLNRELEALANEAWAAGFRLMAVSPHGAVVITPPDVDAMRGDILRMKKRKH